MDNFWKKRSKNQINEIVFEALDQNVNYSEQSILGVPASHLDTSVFYQDAPFLKDAPFLSTLIKNPNHIGCHTTADGEPFFAGTHKIEKDLIKICACDILKANPGEYDGYVASGGTEANLQAIWIYRNLYQKQGLEAKDLVILCSADSHYSMDKAANLMGLDIERIPVDKDTRTIQPKALNAAVEQLVAQNKKAVIVVANMMTTMFGSIDDPNMYSVALKKAGLQYKIHVDGAYGGFYYPFTSDSDALNFKNPEITSVTLDAHKMAQAPYGTGIFITRKGYMDYVVNGKASYVKGDDYTISGSRSGANAVAVWMILTTHGPFGWKEKTFILQKRTDWLCEKLDQLNLEYFREPSSNIVTIKNKGIPAELVQKFGLVPDKHSDAKWLKIVVMDHVTIEKLQEFLGELSN